MLCGSFLYFIPLLIQLLDYFGNALPYNVAYDIGAHEWRNSASGISNIDISKVKVYPNPIHDGLLFIDLQETKSSDIQVNLFDISGELLLEKSLKTGGNQLDINDLQKGVYILLIQTEGTIMSYKLIKNE